jgi:hypothetical protein
MQSASRNRNHPMFGSRWQPWMQRGVLTTAALAVAPATGARAEPRYPTDVSVGMSLGVAFAPKARVAYGFDLRFRTSTERLPFIRLEGRGISSFRLVGGVQVPRLDNTASVVPLGYIVPFAELGVAFHSRQQWDPLGWSLGVHAGLGLWNQSVTLGLAATPPVLGDRRNYDAAALATYIPLIPYNVAAPAESGRLLRVDDGIVLPAVICGTWGLGDEATVHASERAMVAAERIQAARMEYASIPAFERMAAELAVVGAPAALVERARAAADDERRHTGLCLALAGVPAALAPLPSTAARPRFDRATDEALATLAREAWTDGCLGEGAGAASAARAAITARCPAVRDAERTIARDEHGHAELAWQALAWLWRAGGAHTRDAIEEAVFEEPAAEPAPASSALDEELLAAAGIIGKSERRQSRSQVQEMAGARAFRLMATATRPPGTDSNG